MNGAMSFEPLSGSAPDPNAAAAADGYPRREAVGPTDNSGRLLAVEPPAWDLMPPAETETVRRFRPA